MLRALVLTLVLFLLLVSPAVAQDFQGTVTGIRLVSDSPPLSVCIMRLEDGSTVSFYAPFARIDNKLVGAEGIRPFMVGDFVVVSLIEGENGFYYLDLAETPEIYRRFSNRFIAGSSHTEQLEYQAVAGKIAWNRSDLPVRFYYHHNTSAYSSSLTLPRILLGAQIWNDVETSYMEFEYAGNATGPPQSGDDRNSVGWADQFYFGSGELGVTYYFYDPFTLDMYEFDIYLNEDANFGFNGELAKYDFASVITHELGHAAGLEHSYIEEDIMYPTLANGEIKLTPSANDIYELQSRYPAGIITGRLLTPSGNPVYLNSDYPVYIYAYDIESNLFRYGETAPDGSFRLHSLPAPYLTVSNIALFFDALDFSLFSDEPVQSVYFNAKYSLYDADLLAVYPDSPFDLGDINLPPESVIRLYGNNRFHTAELAAQKFFSSSTTAIVASGMNYPDALCAAPLAAALNAPVLLTRQDKLSTEVKDFILKYGITDVVIVGGPAAVSSTVEAELLSMGLNVEREAGKNRYETAAVIADRLYQLEASTDTVFIATGENFPDALSVGPVAAFLKKPVLLVLKDAVPGETLSVISERGISHTVVIGGEAAISDEVASTLPGAERWGGENRFETAVIVAQQAANLGMSFAEIHLATGMDFPDALAAAAAAGKNGSPVILTKKDIIPTETSNFLSANKNEINRVYLYGGYSAVSYSQQNSIRNLIN